MTRRRRGLWWELKRTARRVGRQMMPHRVLWRFLSGPEIRRGWRGTTVMSGKARRRALEEMAAGKRPKR